jgi:hypothetical protein
MNFDAHRFMADLFGGLLAHDKARVESLIHPEFVSDLRQSGERSVGFENFWAQFVSYPGSAPVPNLPDVRLLGEKERYAMSPGYTVVPLASPNDYTVVGRSQYPDGSWWHAITLIQIRDGMLYRLESYFAPELPAPLAESIATYQHG